jgi:hypothetical protein
MFGKPLVPQVVKQLSAISGTLNFITALKRASYP